MPNAFIQEMTDRNYESLVFFDFFADIQLNSIFIKKVLIAICLPLYRLSKKYPLKLN